MVLMQKPSMVDSPFGGAPMKSPRWDLPDTEGYGGGNSFSLAPYLVVWGYVGIYRRKKYVSGATWGPRGWRVRPCLMGPWGGHRRTSYSYISIHTLKTSRQPPKKYFRHGNLLYPRDPLVGFFSLFGSQYNDLPLSCGDLFNVTSFCGVFVEIR